MASTAVILVDAQTGTLPIAALTLLDRLVVSLSRAQVGRIILVGPVAPPIVRSGALRLSIELLPCLPPSMPGRILVTAANVLVAIPDLRKVIESNGRLVTPDGQRLPLGVVDGLSEDWLSRLDEAPKVVATQVAALVTSPDSARQVERAYWASLTSSSDGFVDRHFNRPVGRPLSKLLVHTEITPNQISLLATLVGLAAAWLFATGTPRNALAAALLLQASAILDCVDGDLARALFKQSPLGKWLDIVGDQVVHIGVFLGLGIGLWRSGSSAPVITLGIVAGAGVILSFLVVLRALLKPTLRGSGRLQKLIDATTNRDFSVLLIVCAWFEALDWFLWLAAVGSHLFWVVAATLQFQEARHASDDANPA